MKRFTHKFRAKPTTYNEKKYSSKLEASYAKYLDAKVASGELLFYLEQVPFKLPGNNIYRLDFMEFHTNGDIILTETKGFETPTYKLKSKLFHDTYPLTINVVRKCPK